MLHLAPRNHGLVHHAFCYQLRLGSSSVGVRLKRLQRVSHGHVQKLFMVDWKTMRRDDIQEYFTTHIRDPYESSLLLNLRNLRRPLIPSFTSSITHLKFDQSCSFISNTDVISLLQIEWPVLPVFGPWWGLGRLWCEQDRIVWNNNWVAPSNRCCAPMELRYCPTGVDGL